MGVKAIIDNILHNFTLIDRLSLNKIISVERSSFFRLPSLHLLECVEKKLNVKGKTYEYKLFYRGFYLLLIIAFAYYFPNGN